MDEPIIEHMGRLEFTGYVRPKMKPMTRPIQNKLGSGFNPSGQDYLRLGHGIQVFGYPYLYEATYFNCLKMEN